MNTIQKKSLATYNVPYPTKILTLSYQDKLKNSYNGKVKKSSVDAERFTIKNHGLTIDAFAHTFENLSFEQCNFHTEGGAKLTKYDSLTFENTIFSQCTLGTNAYHRVIFKKCEFRICDFKHASFDECSFIGCSFNNCTAEYCRFHKTEISPRAFWKGINEFPKQNYAGADEESEKRDLKLWYENRLFIGNQLLTSSKDVSKSEYVDEAFILTKEASIENKHNNLLHRKDKESRSIYMTLFSSDVLNVIELFWNKFQFWVTKGGTSIRRLLYTLFLIILALSFYLSLSTEIEYLEKSIALSLDKGLPSALFSHIRNYFYALSLFLGFGYSNFSSSSEIHQIFLVLFTCMGFVWYALAIQIIIRKLFK
jgi:hypothetical protein